MSIVRGTIGEIVEAERKSEGDLSVEWRMCISDFLQSDKFGDVYLSPDFEFDEEKWHLLVHMNWSGWNSASKIVSASVIRNNGEGAPPKTLLCTFGLRTPGGVEKNLGYRHDFSGNCTGFGVRGLWKRADLMEDESILMPGKVLVITCDLKRVEQSDEEKDIVHEPEEDVIAIPPDLESLSRDLGRLLQGGIHPDLKLRWGDRIVPAHRCVLTARSPVLAEMIQSDEQGDNTRLLDLSHLGMDVDLFLQYLYSGEFPDKVSVDMVPDLYAVASRFEIDALKRSCRDAMMRTLAESNCVRFLMLAEQHGDEALKEAAVDFICQRKDFLKSDAWKKFAEERPGLAREVLFQSRRIQSQGIESGF